MKLRFENNGETHFSISLPYSKSISNRASILEALSEYRIKVQNNSLSNDAVILRQLLKSSNSEKNTEDAGTVMRFLCAYFTISKNFEVVTLRGTKRMHSRPIGPLVDVLLELGANIKYLEKEGFPPVQILNTPRLTNKGKIHFSDTKSSQFISALMLIAPKIKGGLELTFEKELPSFPYLEITAQLMRDCGLKVQLENGYLRIIEQKIDEANIIVESDWSSASYLYSIAAIRKDIKIHLKNLTLNSIQGDAACAKIYQKLGVRSEVVEDGIVIQYDESLFNHSDAIQTFDFKNNPDLAMSVITCLAFLKKNARISGLGNLVYKESNRIQSLQTELSKVSCELKEADENIWFFNAEKFSLKPGTIFHSHSDHRMAMSLSIFAFLSEIEIEEPEVVEKSFPAFWEQNSLLGLQTS